MKKLFIKLFVCIGLVGCEEPYDRDNNGFGGAVFYSTSSANGQVTVSVSNSSFVVPTTTNPDKICELGTTGYIGLSTGEHKYKAVSQFGRTWEGTVIVTDAESSCSKIGF